MTSGSKSSPSPVRGRALPLTPARRSPGENAIARQAAKAAATDARFMREALRQARRALGRTSPNPPVGAIVVRGTTIVGRGFTRPVGGPHAEVEALRDAGEKAAGATLYVTLEPCAHHGRTPPCVDAVRNAGIARVVIGCRDPNRSVKGDGAGRLRRRGLDVTLGVLESECTDMIRFFRKHIATGLPWVTLKLAASLDGRIATASGDSRWITGDPARRFVHRLRDTHDAVLVGAETVRADDPALTCRLRGGRDPVRVVLDGRLRLPPAAKVVRPGTIVLTRKGAAPHKIAQLRRRGAEVLELRARDGVLAWRDVLTALAARGIRSVLVEGGGIVAATALRARLVDRLLVFHAPKLVGGDGRPMIASLDVRQMSGALEIEVLRTRRLGDDLLVEAEL